MEQWRIVVTLILVVYSYFRKALTPTGILAAAVTAAVHAYHPWNLPFVLLCTFFVVGTLATKVKHGYKSTLTTQSKGTAGGEGPRTHTQVLANSLVASSLTWTHTAMLKSRNKALLEPDTKETGSLCYSGSDLMVVGIIAAYAVAAADTLGSELGILARSEPRLITDLRKVPRGTNGGVTIEGLLAGLLGSSIISATAVYLLPFCTDADVGTLGGGEPWTGNQRLLFGVAIALWGVLGSIFDSWLGATFQMTVKDVRTGKVIEGEGGTRALMTAAEMKHARRAAVKQAVLHGEGDASVEKTGGASSSAIEEDDGSNVASREKYDPLNKARKSSFGDEKPSRVIETGSDVLDNNDVNFVMSFFMSVAAMAIASRITGSDFTDTMKVKQP